MRQAFYNHPYMSRPWNNLFTFAKPFRKNGDPAVYTSILLFLYQVGEATKTEILVNGLGRTGPFYEKYEDMYPGMIPYDFEKHGPNGYLSKMFGNMKHAGLISYSTRTKKWSLGPRYEEWKYWLRTGKLYVQS